MSKNDLLLTRKPFTYASFLAKLLYKEEEKESEIRLDFF